ncbi:hypothetical protein [Bifidobacterium sp. SO1]|uniref:hypothetical protein n=1 Tax=Bifidobacterium sp. SO1 TaxID=2809029 RepID=UPI001BDDA286|nr:hypothetical protein [Bifidobacterium sp. SO1]MBT1162570.1 hypothetical protein [Bifidobacterium sp. SO1]
MSDYRQRAEALLRQVEAYLQGIPDQSLRVQVAQVYATLELAEQTRLQTLLFCRQFGDISDSAMSIRHAVDESQNLGVDCMEALTDDDLKTLGINKDTEHFG